MKSIDSLLSNYIKNDTDSLVIFTCPYCSELPVGCLLTLLQDTFPNCQMIRLCCPKGSTPFNHQTYFVCVNCKKRYQRLKPTDKHYEKIHTAPPLNLPQKSSHPELSQTATKSAFLSLLTKAYLIVRFMATRAPLRSFPQLHRMVCQLTSLHTMSAAIKAG